MTRARYTLATAALLSAATLLRAGGAAAQAQPAGAQGTSARPAARAQGTATAGTQSTAARPAGARPATTRPAGARPTTARPAATQPATSQPAASQPTAARPATGAPSAARPRGAARPRRGAPPPPPPVETPPAEETPSEETPSEETGQVTQATGSQTPPGAQPEPGAGASSASSEEEPGVGGSSEGEPALPAEPPPPTLTAEQSRLVGPSQGELTLRDQPASSRRFFLPPYLREWGPGYSNTILFPFYFESNRGDDHGLLIPPYFRLRTPRISGDVLFPIFWGYSGTQADGGRFTTHVVPPFYYHQSRGPERAHAMTVGLAPLFHYDEAFGPNGRLRSEHLVIPPLLTYHQWTPTSQATVVGPVVYVRDRRNTSYTVFPFVFGHSSPTESWTVIPPLLTYTRTDREHNRNLTVVGPFFAEGTPTSQSYNLAPLFFHWHDRTSNRTTFFPLFHHESGPEHFTLVTPLGGYTRSGAESTLILPFYQNHRGATNFDAVAPLFFRGSDPRVGSSTTSVGIIGFHTESPSGYAWALFPFAARFHEYGRHDTFATPLFVHSNVMSTRSTVTWVFPSVHVETSPSRTLANVYPLFFHAHGEGWNHTVFAPFFAEVNSRANMQHILLTPFYGTVSGRTSTYNWAFPNVLWWEETHLGERSWGWDVAPFVQYGRPRPGDEYWSLFYGLVGFRRQGSYQQGRLFWVPFGISGSPPTSEGSGGGGSSPAPGGASGSSQARGGGDDVRIEM